MGICAKAFGGVTENQYPYKEPKVEHVPLKRPRNMRAATLLFREKELSTASLICLVRVLSRSSASGQNTPDILF